jgi:LAO/AO transport system kinase
VNLKALLAGEAGALARALSRVELGGEYRRSLVLAIAGVRRQAIVIGVTGPAGVGKSTLISAFVNLLRASNKSVAVLAIDPTSPLSGGALLGDRVRMSKHSADAGIFIRSLSSQGHPGGLNPDVPAMISVIAASGREVIILETIGAGQSDTEVAELADVTVVISAPGMGDDVQAMKSGILEIADILVVNRADSPLTDRAVQQLEAMLRMRAPERSGIPVLRTVATQGAGIEELWGEIQKFLQAQDPASTTERNLWRIRQRISRSLADYIRRAVLRGQGVNLRETIGRISAGELDSDEATAQLGARLEKDL